MHKLFSISLCLLALNSLAQEHSIKSYVELYQEIAIAEMHRTGIPASIKLAQGILESDAGRSDLANNAHNHFGLKCGVGWEGDTYFKDDDDRDRRGRLIPSCFRVFESAEASYIAHSEFLLDPRKAYRYGFLFELDPYDYKSWAWGLKQSGYATNPKYALLIISIIEKYYLYSFDYYEPQKLLVSTETEFRPKPTYTHSFIQRRKLQTPQWKQRPEKIPVIDAVITNNGLLMAYARQGDTPEEIAARHGRSLKDVLAYNERLTSRDQQLRFTERVYFQKKKRAYKGSLKYHTVVEGETMYDIAQTYGIQLEKLYVRNRMYPGTEPAHGEKICLKGMIKSKNRPKLRYVDNGDLALQERPPSAPPEHKIRITRSEKKHVVNSGETLYAIASQYNITVALLKDLNNLESNLIRPGQVLVIN
ncbi:MAG: LysM peptidoglycan-binding domain-containing protein [Saprospiraceae bacterium]|nr:LysM peptidoglycan-binding domain-containing protein [Saprospiraceae bacterium]